MRQLHYPRSAMGPRLSALSSKWSFRAKRGICFAPSVIPDQIGDPGSFSLLFCICSRAITIAGQGIALRGEKCLC